MRPLEVETLHGVDAEALEHNERRLVFDAFGDRVLAHATGDGDDRFDEYLVVEIVWQIADEEAVDLDGVGLQML